MKIKKVNKILASIMLFLILFSIIQPVFAASGSGKWSGGQYASGMSAKLILQEKLPRLKL